MMRAVGSVEQGVLFGGGGQLFLADGGHSILDIVTGRKRVADQSFANFEENLRSRQEKARAVNAQFLHVIFPDKQSVLKAEFPFPSPICLGEIYQERCSLPEAPVLNLAGLLRRQPKPPFQKTDTHMTDLGTATAAGEIAAMLTQQAQSSNLDRLLGSRVVSRVIAGDLGRRFDPVIESQEEFIVPGWPQLFFHNDLVSGNDGMVDIFIAPDAPYPGRVLWFGDSFGRGCVRILSFFFREIVFLRTRFMHEEMLQQMRPNFVVSQNVERYMSFVDSDDEALPFLMYPHLKQITYAPNKRFAEAFSAMLSYPRLPYHRFMNAIAPTPVAIARNSAASLGTQRTEP
jgi:hypothetical protein